jgi:hypothetical protein
MNVRCVARMDLSPATRRRDRASADGEGSSKPPNHGITRDFETKMKRRGL